VVMLLPVDCARCQTLGELLSAWLDRMGWTPADLARACRERGGSCDDSTAWRWLSGETIPDDRNRVILFDVLAFPEGVRLFAHELCGRARA